MRSVILPFLLVAILLGSCDKQSSPAPQATPGATPKSTPKSTIPIEPENTGTLDISHRGEAMPVTVFEAPNGDQVTLGDFRGQPMLVNLWATWCGPCVAEMPTLDALAARESKRLQVMVVSQDTQGRKIVDDYWAKQSFKLLQPYLDAKADLGFAFATGMVPTTVLYDKDGKEVWRVIGGMNWDGPRANNLLAPTLATE